MKSNEHTSITSGGFIDEITSSGYRRVTCQGCQRSVVYQPHMNEHRWKHEAMRFKAKHANCKSAQHLTQGQTKWKNQTTRPMLP